MKIFQTLRPSSSLRKMPASGVFRLRHGHIRQAGTTLLASLSDFLPVMPGHPARTLGTQLDTAQKLGHVRAPASPASSLRLGVLVACLFPAHLSKSDLLQQPKGGGLAHRPRPIVATNRYKKALDLGLVWQLNHWPDGLRENSSGKGNNKSSETKLRHPA